MEEETEKLKSKETKTKFWKDSNTLLSFSAIFISAVTLFILIYQTNLATKQFDLEQKQQLATVMPYLHIAIGTMDSDEFTLTLENFGLGPAFIKDFRIYYKDSIYEKVDYGILVDRLRDAYDYGDYANYYQNILSGSVIAPNTNLEQINISKGNRSDIRDDIFLTEELELEIEYASIYGERWVVRGLFNEPVKTKSITD